MTSREMAELTTAGSVPFECSPPEIQETHISFVLLCNAHVIKFKKPVTFDFLDFSTLELRKHFCNEEVRLNNRLSQGVYLGVEPLSLVQGRYILGDSSHVIDYGVRMKRMPSARRMDLLLKRKEVTSAHMDQLASQLVRFHKHAKRFPGVNGVDEAQILDLIHYENEAVTWLGRAYGDMIRQFCDFSQSYLNENKVFIRERADLEFTRECHGDLHTRNIFLLQEPVIFDCVEFSESLRNIDLLSEIAFLCMDLEDRGAQDLASHFFKSYNDQFTICRNSKDFDFFLFLKSYRANVRAKITLLALRNSDQSDETLRNEARQYLDLMEIYGKAIR